MQNSESLSLSFLGATDTVTGSKTLLRWKHKNILVDAGVFQGDKETTELNNISLSIAPKDIDYIFITHGHLDHCGYLPVLYKLGYQGKVFCTHLTQQVVKIILEDALKVQERSLMEKKIDEALFTELDVLAVNQNFQTFDKNRKFKIGEIEFEFFEAGHIIGASSLQFTCGNKKITFSGDLGRSDDLIHYPAQLPPETDYLVLESTYGDRVHEKQDYKKILYEHIKHIKDTGGVLLIPAFAVARTQVVLTMLAETFNSYPESELPIFVDSPMASKVTKLYLEHHKELKINKEEFLETLSHTNFLDFGKDQKKFLKRKGPFILVSASGMISGGKVLKYFDMFAKNEMNTILIVGYQAPGTIGRRVLDGETKIELMGHEVDVRAHVEYIKGLSAHADKVEMKKMVSDIKGLKRIFLNHGESDSQESFKDYLQDLGIDVEVSKKNKSYTLE